MSQSDQSDGNQNSPIGYRRPPVNRQFKPGQSGNPNGRPKGQKNLATMLAAALSEKISIRDKNGKTRRLTKQEAIIEIIVNKALSGDLKTFEKVIQLADKLGVFKEQAAASSAAIGQDAYDKIMRRVEELAQERVKVLLAENELRDNSPSQVQK
jgi:uncharacterized protein DUF5681